MPNQTNITAPINVHGIGRSGTTLLQNILGATGTVQVCNEMAALVFCCFRGGEVASGSEDRNPVEFRANAGAVAAQAALCATMASEKPHWCQKLGGLPNYISWDMVEVDDLTYASEPFAFPYCWFWKTLRTTFPHSRDVLILRDYRDVIVSRHHYSGWHSAEVAADIAVYFNLMAHQMAKIDCIVRYENIVADPVQAIHRLFSALGLADADTALRAINWHGSPSGSDTLAAARSRRFSWKSDYASLITKDITQIVAPAICRLEAQLGIDLSAWRKDPSSIEI